MRLVVIKEDNMIEIDGEALNFDFAIDENIHAIQWYETSGVVEYKDGTPNLEITDITPYQYLVVAHTDYRNLLEAKEIEEEEAYLVGFGTLRARRDRLLSESDYTMLPDYTGTDVAEWVTYRQALRDLPDGYVPVKNATYPVKPGFL